VSLGSYPTRDIALWVRNEYSRSLPGGQAVANSVKQPKGWIFRNNQGQQLQTDGTYAYPRRTDSTYKTGPRPQHIANEADDADDEDIDMPQDPGAAAEADEDDLPVDADATESDHDSSTSEDAQENQVVSDNDLHELDEDKVHDQELSDEEEDTYDSDDDDIPDDDLPDDAHVDTDEEDDDDEATAEDRMCKEQAEDEAAFRALRISLGLDGALTIEATIQAPLSEMEPPSFPIVPMTAERWAEIEAHSRRETARFFGPSTEQEIEAHNEAAAHNRARTALVIDRRLPAKRAREA
jgi:hypothetical protein